MTPKEKIHFAISYVAQHFHMTAQQLLDDKGGPEPLRSIRHMAFFVAIRAVDVPSVRMADELGRDRTTVKSNYGQARDRVAADPWWRNATEQLIADLRTMFEFTPDHCSRHVRQISSDICSAGLASTADQEQKERVSETA